MSNDNPELREKLAEYAHTAWSGWMKYLFSKGRYEVFTAPDGFTETCWIMPAWAVRRWGRQLQTPYAELPEEEKESDRQEAEAMLAIMQATASGKQVNWAQAVASLARLAGDLCDDNVELRSQLQAPNPAVLPAEVAEALDQILTMISWHREGSYAEPLAVVRDWLRSTNTRRDDAEDKAHPNGE